MLRGVILYTLHSVGYFILIVSIGAMGHFFLLEPSEVNGRSMEPTFHDEEIIVIEKLSLLASPPKRGQIVSAFGDFEDLLLVKRVVGLPGEQVVVQNGAVYIRDLEGNEVMLEEPYLTKNTRTNPRRGTRAVYPILGANEYFLLGDNREASTDSRHYGAVHRSHIVGRVRKIGIGGRD